MDECRAERKGQRQGQTRKKRQNQRIKVQQYRVREVYDRGNSGVPGERESARERKIMT
jgi:hypothetical protein